MAPTFESTKIPPQPVQQRDRSAAQAGQSGEKSSSGTASAGTSKPNEADPKASSSSSSSVQVPTIDVANFATGKGGGALRSIDQKFSVNPSSGSLSLSIPLPITGGRQGFHPELDLDYDSGSGNGPFGIGWYATAPNITRKTSHRIPKYGPGTDIFVFAGAEDLVPSLQGSERAVDGYTVRKFEIRVEGASQARVEQLTSLQDPNDVYWRTVSSDNTTNIYGRDDSSRLLETIGTQKRIFSWLLCESYDAFGNAISYTYKAENSDGVFGDALNPLASESERDPQVRNRGRYLKSIKYGNSMPCRNLKTWAIDSRLQAVKWCFELVFDFGEHSDDCPDTTEVRPWTVRQDPFSSCRSGFEIREYRLCRRVLMFHHFPHELGREDYLVSSMSFKYDESPTGSFLSSVVRSSHVFDATLGKYVTESLEPFTLEYTKMSSLENIQVHSIKPTCLQTLPVANSETVTRWIDLDGDGTQGLLVQTRGAWYYQRNEKAINSGKSDTESGSESESESELESDVEIIDDFGPVTQLPSMPMLGNLANATFEDLDGNGRQDVVITDQNGRSHGYYERLNGELGDEWTPLQPFEAVINSHIEEGEMKSLDLTGTGTNDILANDNAGTMYWYESLGKKGWSSQRACNTAEQKAYPLFLVGDNHRATYLCDMTGDGLEDVVQLVNGRVSYWPNLGYGRFGRAVVMDNSPKMAPDDLFTLERLHLLDIDGSGTKDIIYLPPEGGIMVYYNQCGNSWSDGIFVEQFPRVDRLTSVFTLDVLGNGTTCLCWAGPDGSTTDDLVIYYLNLASDGKPHLLKAFNNGRGFETKVSYRPSTKFYLRDERDGHSWRTKLPFPVHVISKVIERDLFTLARSITKYAYHDGFFDGQEQEFRGFGMVEVWERNEVKLTPGDAKPYRRPISYTKLWFHTGSAELPLVPERVFGKVSVQTVIPNGLNHFARSQFCRALHGREMRAETYGLDGTAKASTPYSIEDTTYDIELRQKVQGELSPGVFRVSQRESLSTTYERDMTQPPRVEHELCLERNKYGDVTKEATISYGNKKSSLEDKYCRAVQSRNEVTYTETSYTDAVDSDSDVNFYAPFVASTNTLHISGLAFTDQVDIVTAKIDPQRFFGIKPPQEPDQPSLASPVVVQGYKSRIYYRSADLTHRLAFGRVESGPILVDQEFTLALSKQDCYAAYMADKDRLAGHTLPKIMAEGGYVDLDGDGSWWSPSSRAFFGPSDHDASDKGHSTIPELLWARESFFTPTVSVDPFHARSTTSMDRHWLLPETVTDALGNVSKAVNDYRTLRPCTTVDPNGNRKTAAYNTFGDMTATATLGKADEQVGDYVDPNVTLSVPSSTLAEFMKHPIKQAAKDFLGGWGERILYSHGVLDIDGCKSPPFAIKLTRTEHVHNGKNEESPGDLLMSISYFDNDGTVTQKATVESWEAEPLQWCISERHVNDIDGSMVKAFQPFFAKNHLYNQFPSQEVPATYEFVDAVGRQVGVLYADHTWTKTNFSAWSEITYRTIDTINIENPKDDADIGFYFNSLAPATYSPSWMHMHSSGNAQAQLAAQRSAEVSIKGSVVSHLDSDGREIMKIVKSGEKTRTTRFELDSDGNRLKEFDSLGRLVQDMDAGRQTMVYDIGGKPLLQCDMQGVSKRSVFDLLRRVVETRVKDSPDASEYVWSKTVYGEGEVDAAQKNLRGKVVRTYDQSGVHGAPSYDFKGNVLSETVQVATEYKSAIDWSGEVALEPAVYVTEHIRDALNRVSWSVDALGRLTKHTFDLSGRLTALNTKLPADKEWTALICDSSHAADGLPLTIKYGNGATSHYTYDSQTRQILTKTTRRKDGSIIEDLSYTYDCLNRIVHTVDAAQKTAYYRNIQVKPVNEHWYDVWGRLVKSTGREMVSGSSTASLSSKSNQTNPLANTGLAMPNGKEMATYTETYTYDDADNILSMTHQVSGAATAGWTRSYSYNEPSLLEPGRVGNRLSSSQLSSRAENYSYDASGCIASMPGFSKVQWDCTIRKLKASSRQRFNKDKVSMPETTWYVYDSGGARVRKVTERASSSTAGKMIVKRKETIMLDGVDILIKYGGDGAIASKTTTSMIGSGAKDDSPLVLMENLNNSRTLLRYNLSPSLEVDDKARVVSYEEYSPFGVTTVIARGSGIQAPRIYRFASYRRDKETGFYYCGARYYLPHLGRWLSPDPIGTADGPNIYCY
ncbi:65kDa B protein-domain-containing protein, partial [Mariannaea sp. PMI_226]